MWRDVGVTVALRESLPPGVVDGFALVTVLGSLEVILLVLAGLYGRSVLERYRQTGRLGSDDRTIFIIAAVFGGLSIIVLLKGLFQVPRPPAELMVVDKHDFGFPSGHTLAATVLWVGLARWTSAHRRRTRYLLAGTIVGLVGLSRLALGLHFLPDVLASMVIGGGYLLAIERVARDRPGRAFGIAVAIAVLALVVAGPVQDAVLAVIGTMAAIAGWLSIEGIASARQ